MLYQQNNVLIRLIVSILLASSFNITHAASKPKAASQIIDIKAQYILLDEKKGISKYEGNVFFKKGTLSIQADTITLYYDGKQLTKAFITGSPADVQHYPDNEAKVHSQAKEMEYRAAEDRLTLKGQAFVDQGDNHFSGEIIEYDTRQRTVTAAGTQNKVVNTEKSKNTPPNRRVHVIIGPKDDIKNKDQ